MKYGFKVWLESENNEKFFGDGPCALLILTAQLGSLNRAAKEMKMSYSKAYNIIKNCEAELNITLLEGKIGGKNGGGSTLTNEAKELIANYEKFKRKSNLAIKKIYSSIFS